VDGDTLVKAGLQRGAAARAAKFHGDPQGRRWLVGQAKFSHGRCKPCQRPARKVPRETRTSPHRYTSYWYIIPEVNTWTVFITKRAYKQVRRLPGKIRMLAEAAVQDLERFGPAPYGWNTRKTADREQATAVIAVLDEVPGYGSRKDDY
jgi:hypothetical protein